MSNNIGNIDKYSHYISLGFFCSVALELERLGLRDTSSPFDWIISNFEGVINAIDNKFVDFLNYDFLVQNYNNHEQYMNEIYQFYFFHDFDKYFSLKKQLPRIREKYNRRIERFYMNICEPTLFIRYIADEAELKYIENNNKEIINLLKSYNKQNQIIYIANSDMNSSIINIYNVDIDENDTVVRKPFSKNKEIQDFFIDLYYSRRKNNLLKFEKKQKHNNNPLLKVFRFIKKYLKKVFLKEYVHNRQYKE